MEFCSSHVYVYSNSEDETISADECDIDYDRLTYNETESYLKLYSTTSSSTSNNNSNQQSTTNNFSISSTSKSSLNNNNNNGNVYNSSFIVNNNKNDQINECQYRFCVPKSIALSSINKENSSTNLISNENANGLFYYSSDSVASSKTNNNLNDSSNRVIIYEDDYSTINESYRLNKTFNKDLDYTSHNPIGKLYQQSSLSHMNSVVNYTSHYSNINRTYVKVKKPDTNILAIHLSELVETSSNTFTGDAIYCETCNAILSSKSVLNDIKQRGVIRGKLWDCEYCSTKNLLEIDINEIPTNDDITYLIEPSKQNGLDDDSIIVFCIDISGSMNVTEKIDGIIELKSTVLKKKRFELETGQNIETNDTETYISRLDSLQIAVEKNLEILRLKHPNKRVFLVAFNDNVIILGDGTTNQITIKNDLLNDEKNILDFIEDIKYIRPIRDTKEKIEKRLYSLEANGSTALGPALLYSINIAGKKIGSQVILCTDGLANNGFGNLEDDLDNAINFYDNLTNQAIKLGVTISIITLKGTGCKLSIIGRLSQYTNGYIKCVDQVNIKEEIESIIENNKIVASNAVATLITHKSIYFEDHNNDSFKEDEADKINKLIRFIGNITSGSEITFQYGIKCTEYNLNELNKIKTIPFQLQLKYEAKDGSKVMRVITKFQPYTKDRKIAEKNSSLNLIAAHVLNSQATEVTNKLYSQKTFSSLPIKTKLKSVKQYLKERKYENKCIDESINSLLRATQSKSLSISKKRRLDDTQVSSISHSDEESEKIIRIASQNTSLF